MQFTMFAALLAMATASTATAILAPATNGLPTEGVYTFPASEFSAQAANGVAGTLYWRFINAYTFEAKNVVTDTKGDSHSVFMTTVVYDGGDNVLRCQNSKGHGKSVTCDYRTYDRSKKIKSIAARWCVDIQLGSDDCLIGPKIDNPHP